MKNLHNEELECVILGSIIMNNVFFRSVADVLEAKHFFIIDNQKLYQKICDGINNDELCNHVTLINFFDNEIAGGRDYLKLLIQSASSAMDIRKCAFQVVELAKKRELDDLLSNLSSKVESCNLVDLMNELDVGINKIDTTADNVQIFDCVDMMKDWAVNLESEKNLKPIPTNLESLDKMLNGGLQKGGLYVFGAASGCGKTFFAQNIILNALKCDLGVYFVSMEMQKRKIFTRFISILAKINSFRILKGNIFDWENEKFDFATKEWESYKNRFFITDLVKLSAVKIEGALKRAIRKGAIDLMVIDYAQIMQLRDAKNINEASLIKENIVKLAQIAKKYDISILLLSQLTKDKISGKVGLGSLKGSGGLYEDADCVIAMWAEEEQAKDQIKDLNIEVLKNRDGLSGGLDVKFEGDFGRFTENKKEGF
jgi:replicative DNA helicase